jgi:hypothetical protein
MRHGHGSKKDEIDIDTERFFRAIDRAVLEHHSRSSGLPLLLAALPEYHNLFHKVSHNPFLLPDGIDIQPDAVSVDALRDRAWKAVEPHYLERLARLVDEFGKAKPKGLAEDELTKVAEAAAAGRIARLLIDADRHIPGRIDTSTGKTEFDQLAHPEMDDVLDDLGELVLKKGGGIVIVPAERMPTRTGVAAIYRF